jgi:hypothetical protein
MAIGHQRPLRAAHVTDARSKGLRGLSCEWSRFARLARLRAHMRYMLLIYSQENESATPAEMQQVAAAHHAVMEEAARCGVFRAADPLQPASTATTVRRKGADVLLTDGPYIETKEQLAGYYIFDCEDLDEAIEWASKIPTSCQGAPGCVEVRPIREMSAPRPVTLGA